MPKLKQITISGLVYTPSINIAQARKVRDITGIDLLNPSQAIEAITDLYKTIDVCHVLMAPEMEGEAFAEFLGDNEVDLDELTAWLESGVVNFTRPQYRGKLKKALVTVKKTVKEAASMEVATDQEIEALLKDKLEAHRLEVRERIGLTS